jgi:hypothetical protein
VYLRFGEASITFRVVLSRTGPSQEISKYAPTIVKVI